jgi:hypothetical protein
MRGRKMVKDMRKLNLFLVQSYDVYKNLFKLIKTLLNKMWVQSVNFQQILKKIWTTRNVLR